MTSQPRLQNKITKAPKLTIYRKDHKIKVVNETWGNFGGMHAYILYTCYTSWCKIILNFGNVQKNMHIIYMYIHVRNIKCIFNSTITFYAGSNMSSHPSIQQIWHKLLFISVPMSSHSTRSTPPGVGFLMKSMLRYLAFKLLVCQWLTFKKIKSEFLKLFVQQYSPKYTSSWQLLDPKLL